jgi:hypothetical protein
VNIEVICSDPDQLRQRVENRRATVPGLHLPTWQDVLDREYDVWSVSRIVIDTANSSPQKCVDTLIGDVAALKA